MQTPCQLLKDPHPQRLSLDDCLRHKSLKPDVLQLAPDWKPYLIDMGSSDKDPIVYVDVPPKVGGGGGGLLTSLTSSAASDVMVTVSANATVGTHGWSALDRAAMTSTKTKNDFVVEVDPTFFDANTTSNPGDVTHSRYTRTKKHH